MDVVKFAALAVGIAAVIALVKNVNREYATLLSLAFGVLLLAAIVSAASAFMAQVKGLITRTSFDDSIFKILVKVVGISYIVEFSANVCKELSSESVAEKVRLYGKITVLFMALPLLTKLSELLETVLKSG